MGSLRAIVASVLAAAFVLLPATADAARHRHYAKKPHVVHHHHVKHATAAKPRHKHVQHHHAAPAHKSATGKWKRKDG